MTKFVPNNPRICKACGKEFMPRTSRQVYCGEPVELTCAFCGGTYEGKCGTVSSKTCSPECNIEYMKVRRKQSAQSKPKKCEWCGKIFYPKHHRVVYCDGPHYKKCEVCGKMFELDVKLHRDRRSCSKECFKVLQVRDRDFEKERENQRKALLEKYGVDNPGKIPGAHEKAKKTMLEKYGKEWYTQTDEYKERAKKTSLEKYGTEHWLASEEVKAKREATCLEKFGATNVFASEYGKDKVKKFFRDNYGVENYSQVHIVDMYTWNKFKQDPEMYLKENFDHLVTFEEVAHKLGVSVPGVRTFISREVYNKYFKRNFSTMETSVTLLLSDIDKDILVYHNVRTLIPPREIDIYLPEFKLGIECNPSSTHNSSGYDPWGNDNTDTHYHFNKTNLAESKGIFLLHLFGYEWRLRKDAVETYLIYLLDRCKRSISTDETTVREISIDASNEFLNKYHISGHPDEVSVVSLGLYLQDELVSVMSFGEQRYTVNYENEYELQRYCCKKHVSVPDGDSYLFEYFLKNYSPNSVTYLQDRAHDRGDVCKNLGFIEAGTWEPQYFWSNIDDKSYCDVHDLNSWEVEQFLGEDVSCNTDVDSIMLEKGYVKIYDSCIRVWIYTCSK